MACWTYAGRSTPRAFLALLIAVFGTLAAYDGIMLARREYARAHDGQLLPASRRDVMPPGAPP